MAIFCSKCGKYIGIGPIEMQDYTCYPTCGNDNRKQHCEDNCQAIKDLGIDACCGCAG